MNATISELETSLKLLKDVIAVENPVEIPLVLEKKNLLTVGTLNGYYFSSQVIQEAVEKFNSLDEKEKKKVSSLYLDHKDELSSLVGYVEEVNFSNEEGSAIGNIVILDFDIAFKVQHLSSKNLLDCGVSPTVKLTHENNKVIHFEFLNFSLVINPAGGEKVMLRLSQVEDIAKSEENANKIDMPEKPIYPPPPLLTDKDKPEDKILCPYSTDCQLNIVEILCCQNLEKYFCVLEKLIKRSFLMNFSPCFHKYLYKSPVQKIQECRFDYIIKKQNNKYNLDLVGESFSQKIINFLKEKQIIEDSFIDSNQEEAEFLVLSVFPHKIDFSKEVIIEEIKDINFFEITNLELNQLTPVQIKYSENSFTNQFLDNSQYLKNFAVEETTQTTQTAIIKDISKLTGENRLKNFLQTNLKGG